MSKALELALAQKAAGKTFTAIGKEIDMSRSTVSLWMRGKYDCGTEAVEALVLNAYDRRICPADGDEKKPEQCRRIALRPRPHGFPDAESLWICCQSCPHKPNEIKTLKGDSK